MTPTPTRIAAYARSLEWAARRALVLRRAFPGPGVVRWRRSGVDENAVPITLVVVCRPQSPPGLYYVPTADLDAAAAQVPEELVWFELAGLKPTPPESLAFPPLLVARGDATAAALVELRRARVTGRGDE